MLATHYCHRPIHLNSLGLNLNFINVFTYKTYFLFSRTQTKIFIILFVVFYLALPAHIS